MVESGFIYKEDREIISSIMDSSNMKEAKENSALHYEVIDSIDSDETTIEVIFSDESGDEAEEDFRDVAALTCDERYNAISLRCAKLAYLACNSATKFDRVLTCIRKLQEELARIDITKRNGESTRKSSTSARSPQKKKVGANKGKGSGKELKVEHAQEGFAQPNNVFETPPPHVGGTSSTLNNSNPMEIDLSDSVPPMSSQHS
ncbi:hypothetical protein Scep_017275 [Stephania cephalantha]|uniref:Uncharacterized protein n=1 Tax=Stephania cephalantha TaxID=152367 RepID=A0AAP0NTE8_9MAGN